LKSIADKWFFLQTHDSDFEARCHGLLVIFERASAGPKRDRRARRWYLGLIDSGLRRIDGAYD